MKKNEKNIKSTEAGEKENSSGKLTREEMDSEEAIMEDVLEELEAEDMARHQSGGEAEYAEPGAAGETDDSSDGEEPGDEESAPGDEKTKKPGKTDKKEEAFKEKIAALEDQVKRQMAEFDNFRKRTEREKSQMFESGAASVIEKILPVLDNFERGLGTLPEEEKNSSFAEGMTMIYKQLGTELENIGVKPIEALGEAFDPNLHNAVMQDTEGDAESGTVTRELLKGYKYRDTVIRHSMVAVKS